MKNLLAGSYDTNLPGEGDTIIPESPATVEMEVGEWTAIEVSLKSIYNWKRSGVGVVFYLESGADKGQLWGGDGGAVPAGTPPDGYPAGSRYCVTDTMASGGKATIWFKATGAGEAVIKAAVPASATKRTKALGPNAGVTITIGP
jgi:hypothetical protein